MAVKQIIKTKRLILEPIKRKYFKEMYALIRKDNKELSRWTTIPYPTNRKKTYDFYKKGMKSKNHCIFVIINEETKKVMGGIDPVKEERNNNVTIGYWIGKEFRKKGYMTEAAQAVINFCFKKLKVMRIEITAKDNNLASQGVIKKCGLKYEGTKRMGAYNGLKQYGNLKMYSIIRPEWKE